jgi:hypothetical protein
MVMTGYLLLLDRALDAAVDRGCVPTDRRDVHRVSMPVVGVCTDGHGASIDGENIDLFDKIFF